ncbi:NlpC/P60 family protein [Rhodobacter aestuarii]|uniref:NlpC/P60 family protein n=1 Tax=Rhodobacter aestuarii TaxID=453582 RepID=A0A1N7Q130_9RHOB|nr:NlpC/P60 family protein [Rhodobacter aestuarii]PTV94013.1 NlpC/P60 family protein [Rhodobacter aestuarii]SIT16550.1 NlpC/P60 family protein [Rhodobacter aestuarii]
MTRVWWERYIGLPFGEGPGEVTCWGLVVAVYGRELSIDLPLYGEISAHDLIRIARAMEKGKDDGWQAVESPQAFDVVLMRAPNGGAAVVHVGVMIDEARLLHVEEASHAVIVPISHWSVARRILGYRRRSQC